MDEDPSASHEFLVSISNNLPADTPADRRRSLVQKESARAAELVSDGVIVRLWRIPGRRQNVGIWRAANANSLHLALESLPMFPYLNITVTPLASHPSDPSQHK